MPLPSLRSALLATVGCVPCLAQTPSETAPPSKAETVPALLYSTRGDERVHLLSLPELRPIHRYEAGAGAHELAISADGRWALGSAYGGPGAGHQPPDSRVFVLDLPAGTRHQMVDLGATKRPNDLVFVGGSAVALVTTEVPAQVLRLDAARGTFTAWPLAHRTNHMLALAPDAATCFVSHVLPGGLTRLDPATGRELAHAALPVGAEGLAAVQIGGKTRVWVGCNRASKLVVVDGDTLAIEHELPCEGFPLRVKATPDGRHVAVSCPKSGEILVYATATPTIAPRRIDLGTLLDAEVAPTSLAFSPDGTLLLAVANGSPDRLVALELATGALRGSVEAAGPIADALTSGLVQAPPAVR